MNVINEYKDIMEEIDIIRCRIQRKQKEIKVYEQLGGLNGPNELKGIDYTKETVSSTTQIEFIAALEKIIKLKKEIQLLKQRLNIIKEQKKQLENIINTYGSTEKQIIRLRIDGQTFEEIAESLNYSVRQIYRYWNKIRK